MLLYPLKRSLPLFKTRYTLCYYSHCELLKSPPVRSSHRTNIVHHQYAFVPLSHWMRFFWFLNPFFPCRIFSQIFHAREDRRIFFFFQEIKWHAVEVKDRDSGSRKKIVINNLQMSVKNNNLWCNKLLLRNPLMLLEKTKEEKYFAMFTLLCLPKDNNYTVFMIQWTVTKDMSCKNSSDKKIWRKKNLLQSFCVGNIVCIYC